MGVAGISEFFYYESEFKMNFFFWGGEGGGWGERAAGELEQVIFSIKNPNLERKNNWGWVGEKDRWMDRRTGPNQFAPSTSKKLGA